MKTYKNSITMILLSSLVLSACGGGGSSGRGSAPNVSSETSNLEEDMYGIYQAVLSPLNSQVAGEINGSATLVREMNDFIAHVRFVGGPTKTLHPQSVHVGTRCPTIEDDLNHDGFIDAEEGAKVYKEVIIPLDGDLNSQWMGGGTYPLSDDFGNYSYSQTGSYDKMIQDLQEEDINPADDLVKIGPDKSMRALGKVVVIFAVPQTTSLPETVKGRGRLNPQEALPIACGVISKVHRTPGEVDNDHTGIPYTEESAGGNGEDDGANFPSGPVGGEGNYGEDDDDSTPYIPAPIQDPISLPTPVTV